MVRRLLRIIFEVQVFGVIRCLSCRFPILKIFVTFFFIFGHKLGNRGRSCAVLQGELRFKSSISHCRVDSFGLFLDNFVKFCGDDVHVQKGAILVVFEVFGDRGLAHYFGLEFADGLHGALRT